MVDVSFHFFFSQVDSMFEKCTTIKGASPTRLTLVNSTFGLIKILKKRFWQLLPFLYTIFTSATPNNILKQPMYNGTFLMYNPFKDYSIHIKNYIV